MLSVGVDGRKAHEADRGVISIESIGRDRLVLLGIGKLVLEWTRKSLSSLDTEDCRKWEKFFVLLPMIKKGKQTEIDIPHIPPYSNAAPDS